MSEERPIERELTATPDVSEMVDRHQLPPDEAFGILQSEVRLTVLRVLWDAPDTPVAYKQLEERLPVDTDNFYYHLSQLVGHFIRRTESGYTLSYAGEEVVRAIVAGTITEDLSLEPMEIDSRCPYCESTITIQYLDERFTAWCTGCDGVMRDESLPRGTIMSYGFPPAGVLGRSPSELLEAAHILYDSKVTSMMNGVCPECAATVGHSLVICEEHDPAEDGFCDACDSRFAVWTAHACDECGYERVFVPWFKLLTEPAVISFYYEHSDFDRSIPFSKLTKKNAPYIRSIEQTVESTDPLRIRVEMPIEDEKLVVIIDEGLEIIELDRSVAKSG